MSGRPAVLHLDGGRAWAGGQNQVRLLMRELARRGVRQLCLCPRGSPLEARLREDGLPVSGVAWATPLDPRAIAAIAGAAASHDVIHCHESHALQAALLPARLPGRPLVATRRVHFSTSRRTWGRADRVIAISEVVRDALLRAGIPPERIRLVRSAIDPEEVRALPPLDPPLRRRLGLEPGAFLIGNIGQLERYKGQDTLVRAAALLPDAYVAILGDGPERPALAAAAAELGVAARVGLTGFVPDARRALRELDLFVFPSHREPLGSSLLDAMAVVPVVGADAAGAAEILRPVHAATGASLFPPGDALALAELVRRVRGDEDLRAGMLREQQRRLERFDIRQAAEDVLEIYDEVARRAVGGAVRPRGRAPTLAHRAEYAAFAAAAVAAGLLGRRAADAAGSAAGRLAYRLLGIRRRVVESNLRSAFPDRADAWVRGTAAAAYAHLGREALALTRVARLGADGARRVVRVEDLTPLREAVARGGGVILVTGHFGNWEMAVAGLAAHGIPLDAVAQRQANPLFDRTIVGLRETFGTRVIDRREAPRRALRSLRDGRAVLFAADQNAGRAGIFVPFFGRPASTHRGAALLAVRTGAPIFLAYALRRGDGYDLRIEPVDVPRDGDPDRVVHRLTAAFTARLEAAVRAAPDQYFWLHRRWKTRPPEEQGGGG